jgi:hypothetical protein
MIDLRRIHKYNLYSWRNFVYKYNWERGGKNESEESVAGLRVGGVGRSGGRVLEFRAERGARS